MTPFNSTVFEVASSEVFHLHMRVAADACDMKQHKTLIDAIQFSVFESYQSTLDEIITIVLTVNF